MDAVAFAVAAVVLLAALVAAVVDSPRLSGGAVACTGAVYLALVGAVGWPDGEAAVREVAPTVGFLVVILLLSHLADTEGLFRWAAAVTARRAGRSAPRLFLAVTGLAALVTAVLSLDATVVLLTPVVLAAARRMRVPAGPHGWVTGHLANSGSLLMPVSNLTNLLAFTATGLSFLHFTALMAGPWLAAVVVEHLTLRRVFRAELAVPVPVPVDDVPPAPRLALAVVGLTVLGFGAASLVGVSPVWPALAGVLVLAAKQLRSRRTRLAELVEAANVPLALFVFGLAVVVLALRRAGLEELLADLLPVGGSLPALLAVAAVAAVTANLVNNLPATLALLPVAAAGGTPTLLAVLIGVNVGPNLSYAGSLANLLWRRVMGPDAPTPTRYSLVGLATVPLTLLTATTALWLALEL
ncbi:arsenic transporter [Modestobacter sp. I12A-02628]|uniref:Arsenic transporter n=1 Tax=Goekera deserti TaxID=2497753 RepID=A0A7K3WB74_9ACTN|nr:ArsB/NhaD family transporter [Goekera deserti]MPQ97567.1 arsenic transporter [Goekera deserti]NDI47829.1 arsenic transporter [Goekera deserti]NEL53577.1 arsenic transporter [Goekera deserti]